MAVSNKPYTRTTWFSTPDVRRAYADSFESKPEDHRKYLAKFPHLKGKCHCCGKRLRKDWAPTDHVIPTSKGGITVVGNLLPICGPCNSAKGDLNADVYFKKRNRMGLPVLCPTVYEYRKILNDYASAFKKHYYKEYRLALRLKNPADKEAVKEYAEIAVNKYYSEAGGEIELIRSILSKSELEIIKARHVERILEEKRSIMDILSDSNDPKDILIYREAKRREAFTSKSAKSQAMGFCSQAFLAKQWVESFGSKSPTEELYLQELALRWRSGSSREAWRWTFNKLYSFDTKGWAAYISKKELSEFRKSKNSARSKNKNKACAKR